MHTVSSVHSTSSVTHSRTQTANRATTDPIPDVTNVDPADLRSRLEGGEALQEQAASAGVETEEASTSGLSADAAATSGPRARPNAGIGSVLTRGPAPPVAASDSGSSTGGTSGSDATRAIEDLAVTMAVDTATIRQSIDDGSLNQLLAENGVQSSIGMLFNTKL